MNNLAIIPARSGSKGLPDKNIKELNGKPLLAYSVDAALQSGVFDEIMVSTDSEKYAKIARQYGAHVPFLRSNQLSGDKVNSWDVVKDVIDRYKEMGKEFGTICLLQPTSPLRDSEDIKDAYELYYERASVAVISVCEMEHTPLWSNVLPKDNSLAGFIKPEAERPRQELDTYYRFNGAIYIVKTEEVYKGYNFCKDGSFAYIMPSRKSVDIDSAEDFEYAEFLMNKAGKK